MRFNIVNLILIIICTAFVCKTNVDNIRLARSIEDIKKNISDKQNHYDMMFDVIDVPPYFAYKPDPSTAVDLSNRHEFVNLGYKMKKFLPAYGRELWVKTSRKREEISIPSPRDMNNQLSKRQVLGKSPSALKRERHNK